MAALGKIRSKGAFLIAIIGLGLFAFIAEEAFRSWESNRNDARQQVGEVLGEKINVQDFQQLVDEYTDVIKMSQGRDNLSDAEMNQVKDMVWNQFIQSKLIADEAAKVGLTVTDEELQNIIKKGENPMLMQTPFVNQQTGRFDAEQLKKFISEYKTVQKSSPQAVEQYTKIYNYWKFVEKNLRQQTLAQKYQNLLAGCLLSNPVEAQRAFNDENKESDIQLAAFPYSSIKDDQVKIESSELKAKYDELKDSRFKQMQETRDIKYVDYQVVPSAADRTAILKAVTEQAAQLKDAADPSEIIRKSASVISYLGLPVARDAFPSDIAQKLDSIAVGATTAPVENKADNTFNVIKLISKVQLPDSVQFRAIQVASASEDMTKQLADSIYTALKGGADFEAIAKKYNQTGEKNWLVTRQYQNDPSMSKDTRNYVDALNNMAVGELRNIAMTQGNIIVQVLDRKNMITKYNAAVIKKTIDFSKDTYSAAYNKFSQFVSENRTLADMEKNAAKYGFKVQERKDMSNTEHYVMGIPSTRDALKWIFDAKAGDVSPLYECGNNDRMLVVAMTKIHPEGYRSMDDQQVNEMLKTEVMNEKKAEMLIAKAKGVNSLEAAKAKGAVISEVKQVTFGSPVFVPTTGSSEAKLSGAVAATAKGQFSKNPVKGNSAVYLFKVVDSKMRPVKYDEKAQVRQLKQKAMQNAGNFMQELYLNAKIKDNRYLFF